MSYRLRRQADDQELEADHRAYRKTMDVIAEGGDETWHERFRQLVLAKRYGDAVAMLRAQPPAKPSNKGFDLEQARLVSGWRDGESRALAIAVMALRSIESQEPDTHELTLAHQMAQSAREALALIQEVMEP